MEKVYTPTQVAHHNSKKDIWLTINGKVVDVSKFLEEHPGGEEVLIEYAGKDATKAFEGVGHSKEAFNLLSRYQVGNLQGYNTITNVEQSPKAREMEAFVVKDDLAPKYTFLVEFVVPLLVAGAYFCYRCLTRAIQFGP